ncbi:hypothetical protein HK104_001281, partial [Borealophlyctis nickersoniae]
MTTGVTRPARPSASSHFPALALPILLLLALLVALIPSATAQDRNRPVKHASELANMSMTEPPNPANYTYHVELATGLGPYRNGTYSYYWSLENANTTDAAVKFALVLAGWPKNTSHPQAMKRAWAGIGYGASMLNADFNILHLG